MAKTLAYSIAPDAAALQRPHWTLRAFLNKGEATKVAQKTVELSTEDIELVSALNETASDMAYIHSCFDHITEDLLVDSLIYELKALSMRHKFLLNLCKEKGIIGSSPGYTA